MRLATDWNLPIGLAELLPRAGVVNAAFKLAAHGSQAGRQDAGPFPSHRATENFGATSFASQQSRGWYAAIFEDQFSHGCCAQSHLIHFLADAEAGRSLFDDKSADAHATEFRIKGAVDCEQIGNRSVGNKSFRAV